MKEAFGGKCNYYSFADCSTCEAACSKLQTHQGLGACMGHALTCFAYPGKPGSEWALTYRCLVRTLRYYTEGQRDLPGC